MTKKDDAEYCESVDGECELCPTMGKCRFRRAFCFTGKSS